MRMRRERLTFAVYSLAAGSAYSLFPPTPIGEPDIVVAEPKSCSCMTYRDPSAELCCAGSQLDASNLLAPLSGGFAKPANANHRP